MLKINFYICLGVIGIFAMAKEKYTDDQIIKWIWEWAGTAQAISNFFVPPKISWQHLMERKKKSAKIAEEYARAQETRGEAVAENIPIVVDMMLSKKITSDVARVAIDAYKWHSSKLMPRKYGEKIQTEHSGGITTTVINLGSGVNPEETTQDEDDTEQDEPDQNRPE